MRSKTLWTAFALTAMVLVTFSAQAGDHEYVGADKCKMCHKVQYSSWETTTHAKATESAKASTDRAYTPDCLKCHATNASEDFPACSARPATVRRRLQEMSIMKDAEAAKANGLIVPTQATCDGCHTGDDHAKKVVLADNLNNKAAIHEFKNPPGE